MEKNMSRSGKRQGFRPDVLSLEDRKLMTSGGIVHHAARLPTPAVIHPLDALNPPQHQPFIAVFGFRRSVGASQSRRVSEAFQAFANHLLGIPVTISGVPGTFGGNAGPTGGGPTSPGQGQQIGPSIDNVAIGTVPSPFTLPNSIAQLSGQVTRAVSTIENDSTHTVNTFQKGPRHARFAYQALVPFAQAQVEQLGAYLTVHPPKVNPDGTLATPDSLTAINTAFNAIENAIAETVSHPKLFTQPSDFFINPRVNFKLPFSGDPLSQGPGFFGVGPHGIPLRASR